MTNFANEFDKSLQAGISAILSDPDKGINLRSDPEELEEYEAFCAIVPRIVERMIWWQGVEKVHGDDPDLFSDMKNILAVTRMKVTYGRELAARLDERRGRIGNVST